MKKCMVMLLALTILVNTILCASTAYAAHNSIQDEDYNLINQYYEAINQKDWITMISFVGHEYAAELTECVESSYCQDNNIGLHNIEKVNSVSIVGEIDTAEYMPIIEMCEGENIRAYLVNTEISVHRENGFYFNGDNYSIIFMGDIDNERKIVANRMPLENTVEEYVDVESAQEYVTARFGLDLNADALTSSSTCAYNVTPSTITVKRETYGSGIVTVNFKDYVKVVTRAEVAYASWPQQYHYAGILAIKTYAWYMIKTADANLGYHILDNVNHQIYDPDNTLEKTGYELLYTRVDQIWSMNMYNSAGNIFFSEYRSDSGGQNGGVLNQIGAKDLANQGAGYQDILNYYYSNSSASSGRLLFCPESSHVFYRSTERQDGNTLVVTQYCKCGYISVSSALLKQHDEVEAWEKIEEN